MRQVATSIFSAFLASFLLVSERHCSAAALFRSTSPTKVLRLHATAAPWSLRRGGSTGTPLNCSEGDTSPSPSPSPSPHENPKIKSLIDQISKIVAADKVVEESSSPTHRRTNDEDEAKIWRQLGKLRLDDGEYAEASRIFRHGSLRCPFDEGLRHHVRVHEAFHGEPKEVRTTRISKAAECHVEIPSALRIENGEDLFLSLDVPIEAVPASVVKFIRSAEKEGIRTPVTPTRLVHASTKPVLSREACRYLVESAKKAVERRGGWTRDRHYHAPTCDVPVFDMDSDTIGWVRDAMQTTLFPLIASTFHPDLDIQPDMLRIQDCFVVRYDGEDGTTSPGFSSLRPHEDESLVSLTIALNDMEEYDGGGLFIASTGDLLNGDAGTVLCFTGGIVHGGFPVSRGTRWIMTVFLYVDRNVSSDEPGYTLKLIKETAKAL